MPIDLLRERVFDAACFIVGQAGSLVGIENLHPIIIIGTGRCGTNLLVDILRSHSRISGFPGEANELWHPLLEPFESSRLDVPPIEVDPKRFSEISLSSWPANQGKRISRIFSGFHISTGLSRIFFTKSAMISFLIPKIREIFPDAKFVHIYRYGPSVVESYFQKNFGKYSRYKFTEHEYRIYCARYWNACILEIEKRNLDFSLAERGELFEFSYEDLCQNPNDKIQLLSEYLDLPVKGFKYDLSMIASQNYKVRDYSKISGGLEILKEMDPGLRLKGYLTL